MNLWDGRVESLHALLSILLALAGAGLLLGGAHWLLIGRHRDLGNERKFPRQLGMLGLTLLCLVSLVFALPVS